MATMATTSVSVDVASSKTPRTALDHKIDGTLHVLHSSSNMGAVSTLIKSVSSSLIDGERSSHRRRKEMHDELMKPAAVNDILMNDIKKGTQKSAPIGNLSYVDRRLRTHEKRKAQLEGRYDEALARHAEPRLSPMARNKRIPVFVESPVDCCIVYTGH